MQYFYSRKEDKYPEICWPIDYFKDEIDNKLTELSLIQWQRGFRTGERFCQIHCHAFDSGDEICGKNNCKEYEPRNGKNGRCRFSDVTLIETGKEFILTKKGLKEVLTKD